jgi:hypothetical protein
LLSTREERRSRKKMLTWLQNPEINSFSRAFEIFFNCLFFS